MASRALFLGVSAARKSCASLGCVAVVLAGCQSDPSQVAVTQSMVDRCHGELGTTPTEAAWKACIEAKQGDVAEENDRVAGANAAVAMMAAGALASAAARPVYAPPPYSPPPVYHTSCQSFGYQTNCTTTSD